MENDGEMDDMSYLESDEEEEYDLMCKFEDYYMKHVENQEEKKKYVRDGLEPAALALRESNKKNEKPKKKFARSNFISTINSAAYSKNDTPILNYY